MAGSHTVIPGILLSNNTILHIATTNASGLIGSSEPSVPLPINPAILNGSIGIGLNGHSNNIGANTNILRPANKIIVQEATNVTIDGVDQVQSNTQISNSLLVCSQMQVTNDENSGVSSLKGGYSESAEKLNFNTEESQIDEEESHPTAQETAEEEPVIDIMINNVVCSFSVGCHLDLRNIALTGRNVEFRKENGMVTLKLRRPLTTASIWSSGKITCTGSTSEDEAKMAARRVARCLQKLGYNVKFRNYRIVNVLGTCTMPFAIRISQFSQMHKRAASYEPELHPGVTYRIETPRATLKIFSTGSITVTAPSVGNVQSAIETIYPLVKEFSKLRTPEETQEMKRNKRNQEIVSSEDDSDGSDLDL